MLPGAVVLTPSLAAALFATVFPSVSVTVAPELSCPTAGAVASAIAGVRGGDPTAAGAAYQLRLGRSGDVIRADLTSAAGTALWSRSLAPGPSASSCASVADAVALIVERHFREVAWKPDAPDAAGDAPPPPATPSAGRPAVTSPPSFAAVATTTAPPASRPVTGPLRLGHEPPPLGTAAPGLIVLLGPTYWTRSNSASATLEARARIHRELQAGVGVMLPPSSSSVALDRDGSGRVRVTAVPVLASFGLERPVTRRLSAQAAVEGLVTFERGQAESIAEPATAWRTMLAGGAGAGIAWALGDRLRLDARLSGYRTLLGRPYAVTGVPGTVLDPPAWQGLVRVGLGWTFAP
jgi:hypothetical protein